MPARRGSRSKKAASRPVGARRHASAPGTSPRKSTARKSKAKKKVAGLRKVAATKKAASRANVAKKRVAPKPASKRRAAAKPAKKRAAAPVRTAAKKKAVIARRATPKAPPRRATAKSAAAPKRIATPKRPASPAAPKRPAAPPASPPAIVYTKRAIVASFHAARDAVFSACRELTRETWEAPIAPGRWNPRQVVAHLAAWDLWFLEVLPAAAEGQLPHRPTPEEENAFNAQAVAAAARLDAETTLEAYLDGRALVISAVAAIPAEPASRWKREHALGRIAGGYPPHDFHHAAQIRAAAARSAFAPQRAGASEKELLLFELQRARVALVAAIKGIGSHVADRPIAEGKWSPRELVLHCAVRDRVRIEEFDAVLGGEPVSWAGLDDRAMALENERHLSALRHLAWDEAVTLLQKTRDELMQRLLSVPAGAQWGAAHPFGGMLRMLPPHDRKHAEQIQHARIEG